MSNKLKTVLAGIMMGFDAILLIASIALFMDEGENVFLFFIIAMLIDFVLTFDYVKQLRRQSEMIKAQEAEETVARIRRDIEEQQQFDRERQQEQVKMRNVRNQNNDMMDPEELQELLQGNKDKQNDVYQQ